MAKSISSPILPASLVDIVIWAKGMLLIENAFAMKFIIKYWALIDDAKILQWECALAYWLVCFVRHCLRNCWFVVFNCRRLLWRVWSSDDHCHWLVLRTLRGNHFQWWVGLGIYHMLIRRARNFFQLTNTACLRIRTPLHL